MRGRDSKGFFSIDAVFALTLLLIISASFLNVYEGRKKSAEGIGAKLEAEMIGEKLASAINTVYANGTSFSLAVNLPENAGSYSYQISFDNSTRQISLSGPAWGAIKTMVTCRNVKNFVLGQENLKKSIRVFWGDNQIMVVN